MNLISETNTFLRSKTTPYANIYQDFFQPDSDGIMCRHDPSTAKETKYLDGSSVGVQNISYYARSRDGQKAREQLDTFLSVLDLQEYEITTGLFITVEAVTNTAFVSKMDSGEFVYTCSLKIEYERR